MPLDPPPSPVGAGSVDELATRLRALRSWAGDPSYTEIARRVGALRTARGVPAAEARPGRVTVYDVFREGRSRLDVDLLADVAQALGDARPAGWRAAYRTAARAASAQGTAVDAAARTGPRAADRPHGAAPTVRRGPVAPDRPLVGRDGEVARLVAVLAEPPDEDAPGNAAPRVVTVTGLAGTGTTSVALAVAREVPADVVVRVDLHGEPGGATPSAAVVLDALLQALGAPPPDAQARDLPALAAALAAALAGRRTTVVLDDATDAAQAADVVAHLPATARVVATAHRVLDLPAAVGTTLDPLREDDAIALLGSVVGADRVAAEPEASTRLVRACGGLPAALVRTADDVRARPGWSLADHARRVEDLPGPVLHPALAAAHRDLPADHARALRLLALVPVPLDAAWVAVLLGVSTSESRDALAALGRAHLVTHRPRGEVVVPDAVRTLAADLARSDDPFSARATAVGRLAARLLDDARPAVHAAAPHHDAPGRTAGPGATGPGAAGSDSAGSGGAAAARTTDVALAWLDAHRDLLVATSTLAAEHELADPVTDLSALLAPYLDSAGHWDDAVAVHTAAVEHGRASGRSQAGRDLGRALERLGRYDEALAQLVRSLERGDDPRPGQTLNRIGNVYKRLGRFDEAETAYHDAAAGARTAGDPVSEGRAVGNLADVHRILGRHDDARAGYERALALSRRVGDVLNVAIVSSNAAILSEAEGSVDRALAQHRDALASATSLGDAGLATRARVHVGRLLAGSGETGGGVTELRAAVRAAVALGDPDAEAEARSALATALLAAGSVAEAVAAGEAAVELARRVRARLVETEALNALGEAVLAAGDARRAADLHDAARALAVELDDAAEDARARRGLAAAGRAGGSDAADRAREAPGRA
ncbi:MULTISPECIES: tetratricopeptide repeat protein [Cellulosimicrobium]|uniref:Tetratricopeptide repeat protein n=1 Tax=Cellulosimicrobium sp. ES-005 TaxID=3163031 RepID=A0AAU8FXC3_9MICO|nr:tetratricopeptide repeat protein [Cellulosimicrobium cellulans]MCO7274952.1 tetratricopeptide repeat protein [Cellulosimicrobium cellulans]